MEQKVQANKSKSIGWQSISFFTFFGVAEATRYEAFSLELEMSLLKYFEEDVNLERSADTLRKKIAKRWDYSVDAAFRSIAGYEQLIDVTKMSKFFTRLKVPHTQKEIKLLLQRVASQQVAITKEMFNLLMMTQKERVAYHVDQWAARPPSQGQRTPPIKQRESPPRQQLKPKAYFEKIKSKYISKDPSVTSIHKPYSGVRVIPKKTEQTSLSKQLQTMFPDYSESAKQIVRNKSLNFQHSLDQSRSSNNALTPPKKRDETLVHQRTFSTITIKKLVEPVAQDSAQTQKAVHVGQRQQRYEDFLRNLRDQADQLRIKGQRFDEETPFECASHLQRVPLKDIFEQRANHQMIEQTFRQSPDRILEQASEALLVSPQSSQRSRQAPQTLQEYSSNKHVQSLFPILSMYVSQLRCLKNVLSLLPQQQVLHLKSLGHSATWDSQWSSKGVNTNGVRQTTLKQVLMHYSSQALQPLKEKSIEDLDQSETLVAQQLFQLLSDQKQQLQKAKVVFFNSKVCSLIQLFETLVRDDGPSITFRNFKSLLDQACSEPVSQEEVELLILKFNKFQSRKEVPFRAFLSELTP